MQFSQGYLKNSEFEVLDIRFSCYVYNHFLVWCRGKCSGEHWALLLVFISISLISPKRGQRQRLVLEERLSLEMLYCCPSVRLGATVCLCAAIGSKFQPGHIRPSEFDEFVSPIQSCLIDEFYWVRLGKHVNWNLTWLLVTNESVLQMFLL